MSLRTTLSEAAVEYARTCGEPPDMEQIVDFLEDTYRAELEVEWREHNREFIRSAAKAGLSGKPRDDNQHVLPGFDVPATLSVPLNEGKTVYVAFENATRDQAYAHIAVKDFNINHAIEERRKYIELLDYLDTVWLREPDLRAGEVAKRLGN